MTEMLRRTIATLLVVGGVLLAASQANARPGAPELEPNRGWLNTDHPLRVDADLQGQVVLLNFWDYTAIAGSPLPELARLQSEFAQEPFLVIGVQSGRTDADQSRSSVRDAMFRARARHPIVIDQADAIAKQFGVKDLPAFVLVGADGVVTFKAERAGQVEALEHEIRNALDHARAAGSLAAAPTQFTPDPALTLPTGLYYPGKVVAVAEDVITEGPGGLALFGGATFASDSANDRVMMSEFPGWEAHTGLCITMGLPGGGFTDGWPIEAAFNNPQGLAIDGPRGCLYVADAGNHAIRAIHLKDLSVTTLVGNGQRSGDRVGGRSGKDQGLDTPWDLAMSKDGATLYIAMAGAHQIWALNLETQAASAIAGSGRQGLADGPAREALLAEPRGLALSSDGATLYFADTASSSIRALDLATGQVRTIIGVNSGESGDSDGPRESARLNHPAGVTLCPTARGDRLLVADTGNSSIKIVDPAAGTVKHWSGGPAARWPGEPVLRRPGGLCLAVTADAPTDAPLRGAKVLVADTDHHRVLVVDATLASTEHPPADSWNQLILDGIGTPEEELAGKDPDARTGAAAVPLAARPDEPFTLSFRLSPPPGREISPETPIGVRVQRLSVSEPGKFVDTPVQRTLPAGAPLEVRVVGDSVQPVRHWVVEVMYATRQSESGVCTPAVAKWLVSLYKGDADRAELTDRP